MATSTDLVASRAAALRLAQQMGCSGAHQHPDGKWMPCATMEEYEELVKKDKKNTVRVVEQRRRYRNSKGKNKRDWEPLAERGVTSIDTIAGGGLIGGSVKAAPWAPDEEDPDVFTTPRLARRRARQLGCIGVSRRVSRSGNIVWTPCSNMTDYAKRTGSTAFGRNFQRRRARRTLERAVAREVRRQLRRKKSLMETLYEGKALGRKLNRARVAATTPFNRDARDADMDMLVQEGTVWERPATPRVPDLPRVPGLRSRRSTGRRHTERRIAPRIDPAQIPKNVPGDENFWDNHRLMERLTELAGYAQMQKLRRANPDEKLYRLARQVEPLLGIDPVTGSRVGERGVPDGDFEVRPIHRYDGARRFRWGNNSEIPTEMEHLPNEVLDRISRDALAEFDRRQETERLRLLERGEEFEPEWYVRGLASRRSEGLTAGPVGPTEQERSGRRRAERGADRAQRRRDIRDRHEFEMDMADPRVNPRVTETEIDEMAEYYEFAEATGGFQSVRGFKLTPEEDRDLSDTEKAAKYRKATLDAVGEEHRGKPVQRVHWVYGAPGSGKTARTSLGHLLVPDASEAAHTNPDDYKRFHKRWNFGEGSGESHQFSRRESERTLSEALDKGMDVVVQGTGKDGRLMNTALFPDSDYRKGRRGDTASVMHYLHVPDDERSRRIADRRTNQRRRYGAEPEDAMNVLDQVVKYIEEGRVDEAHIYDNSGSIDETPPLVATFKDGNLVIYDEDKFNEIFDPKDPDGRPTVFRGRVADRPQVTAYSKSDDPRRGKTYAERLREEGENPGGFRKWDEARREKAIRERKQLEVGRASGDTASYRGMHTAPTKSEEGGDTLDNLTNMLPLREGESNRIRVRVYGSSGSDPEYRRANDEMEAVFDAVTGKPDEMITVYRALPSSRDASENDQINPGDWVSPSPTYAAIHGEGPLRGEYDIVEARVRAGDLVSEGNSLYEFGWDPEPDPVRLSYYTALDGLTEEEAEAVVDLLGRGFRSRRDLDVLNSKDSQSIERRGGKTTSKTLKKGNDDYDRMVKVGYVFEPITGARGHSGGVFPPDRVLGSIRGWALEQGLRGAGLEPHPRTPLDGTVLPPFMPEEVVEKVIEKIYRNHYDQIGDQHKIKREGFDSFVKELEARQLQRTVEAGEDTIDWDAMVPLKPDDIVLINDEHWEAITEVLKDYGITPDLDYMQEYGQRNNNPSAVKAGGKDDAHHGTLRWLRGHLVGPPGGVFRDERDADNKPIRTVIDTKIIDEDMKRIADGEPGWLGAVPPSSQTKGARLNDYTKSGYERNRDDPRGPRMLYSFGQGDVDGVEHWAGRVLQTDQQKKLNAILEDLVVLAEMFDEAGMSSPATQDLLDRITGETKKALNQSHEGPLSEERIKQIDDAVAEALAATYQDDDSGGGGGSGGLASRRDDDGESLQDAYRRHLKAKGIQTDGERAFEEQYGYELRSGDGDCYSAAYRAATELVEKGVDADGDPVTNVRVVVGSPVFPKVGERSGHAWVEYDAVKPPPPLMSSADRDHAKEQILALVEDMDLPPGRKQETIDSFLDAIDRANEANAAAPVRDVTMVRDYASVRDGDDILEFDDMDRGRLEALKPDMARDVYYRAGEMEEVDIAGRFSPAEYEETQVGLFGSDFYDGDATFLTREQVDQHLEDMGIDGGLESKRTDDADAEDARLHDEAIEQLREIFVEAGSEQGWQTLDDLAYEMRRSPRGMMMGGRSRPINPENLEAIRELVEERDPEFMGDLVESQRIRETNEGYRRLTESGLDSGVGVHDRETTTSVRGLFDGHVKDGDPIILYHGGPVDLTGDVDYEVSRNDSGQWGPGIYTTASAFPAIKGWANPWQRNAEGGYDTVDPGYLHTTRWKGENPPRILDVMDPIPDDVLDEVVLPTIDILGKEVADAMTARATKPRVRSDGSFTGGGWKPEYAWVAEELDELREDIERKRDGLSGGRDALTGSETLLQLQTFLQTNEVGREHGGEGWNDDGFIPSDRVKAIRDQMNAAIKDLGYDVIKSHEVGIREMTRTDYMFLDPDMVEFVDVATTHSLGGFGNASIGEMAATVRKRATARREADGGGLASRRADEEEFIPGRDRMEGEMNADPDGLLSRRNAGRLRPKEELAALREGRYHPQIGFPDPVTPPESRQPLWDVRGKLAASHLTDVDLMELETYHSLLGKYLERRQTVSDTYQRLWKENDIEVSGYPTWVTDRLYHRPLDTPTKTTLPVRYARPGTVDPDPDSRIAHAEKMQAALVDEFFARHLGEDWRDTNPDTRLMSDGTRGKFGKTAITFASTGLNYSETLELFEQAELLATHHDTFKKHWQKNFDAMKEYAKTSIAVRQVGRAHARSAADAGEEAEFDLGVTLYMPGNDNFRGAVSTDHIAMVNMLEDMLLVSGHGPLSESQVELLGNASEIVLLEHQKYTETNTLTMDRVGDKTVPYESLDTLHEEWHKYDEDAVVVTVPMQMRRKVKRAGIAHIANHLTPEENDAIDAAFGTAGAGDSDAFAAGNVSFLLQAIHDTWAHQSAGYASKSLILQQVMARNLGWDDQKIADDLFHGVDTSGVFGHKDMDVLAPSMARGGITYSEIKERAAAVIESLGDSMLTNVDDRSGRIHIRRDSATGNWIAQDTTTGETWEAPDLEQIERITGLTPAVEDVARDEGISLEEAQEIVNNAAGPLRPTVKSFTLGLTFRESAEPFEQLDRRIGLVLDDLDADSVAEEVRLGRELVGLRRGSGASLTPAERRRRRAEKPEDPEDPGPSAPGWHSAVTMPPHPDDVKNPREILWTLKDLLPYTEDRLKPGATMAEARRIKKAYERVRAHRAARDNARHMVTALVYEHYVGDAFKAALAAEQRTTAARLKEMGVETIPLYRGFILGKDDADSLLSALGDTGALYDDYMMPLTAWSTSKETAKTFGTLHQGANEPDLTGFVVRSDVSVDDIVGLSTHGFGCISEGECVVGHGERHLTIEAVY